ncbi:glucokinase [Dechloromonas denitrificans]|uniref:glucokinase n=1 Tax=Dechloromonas denitrificans TaxID=281362 RepID=UPI001CFAB28B|nr:glucokinase [Dechloromonas denitrificans]UCV07312.1 glucokinase [Dechloromonas denitrificans]
MLLGGDLGGTKTLLALAERRDGRLHIVRQQRYASQDYPTFAALLGDFLAGQTSIAGACFGVAGPTDGRRAKLTYLPWQLAAAELASCFAINRVVLVNDFAAAAHGLEHVAATNILTLQTGQPIAGAPRVILGAGTGLGVAGLVWQADRYRVIPGEGGHFGFSPQSEQQGELWRWLRQQHGRVTSEHVISGPGLARIFTFLGGPSLSPAEIGAAALTGSQPLAGAAVRLWLECYGAFAGDLAMHWLAHGGVYLAGGIAGKLLPHIDRSPFIAAFLDKYEHANLMADMPLHLVSSEDLGLTGALAIAADLA